MNLFSDWDDTEENEDGGMFSHWLEDDCEGSSDSPWKDDGDMKLFKD